MQPANTVFCHENTEHCFSWREELVREGREGGEFGYKAGTAGSHVHPRSLREAFVLRRALTSHVSLPLPVFLLFLTVPFSTLLTWKTIFQNSWQFLWYVFWYPKAGTKKFSSLFPSSTSNLNKTVASLSVSPKYSPAPKALVNNKDWIFCSKVREGKHLTCHRLPLSKC